MGKKLSFKGIIAEGLQERIKLATQNGKRGYKILKFQTISKTPGVNDYETTTKIYTKSQAGAITTSVDFTEADLLAVSYIQDSSNLIMSESVIFDNEVFNQDIYVTSAGVTGTVPTNYYIELETVELSDTESTQLTLKNLRTIASR